MLRIRNLCYTLPDRPLLADVSFDVAPGERVGLIGRNGEGKTTLLRLITGELQPDGGSIELAPETRLGYLRQGYLDRPDASVAAVLGTPASAWSANAALQALADAMALPDANLPDLLARYGDTEEIIEQAGGPARGQVVHATLAGLGLSSVRPDTPVRQLSGGQRTRLELARLLLNQPDMLVLDEPTNHLDLAGLLWLEGFLQHFRGGVLLVSHDRAFLDRVVSRILALDRCTVQSYSGGYRAYREEKVRGEGEQWQTYRRQERERQRLEEQLRRDQERARRTELTTIDFGLRAKAKKGARQAKVKERRLERAMQSTDWVEKPRPEWEVKLDFGHVPPGSRQAILAEGLTFAYGGRPLFTDLSLRIQAGERVVITGPNGGGKSSLLRLLAGIAQPTAGRVRLGDSTRLGYLEQDQWDLPASATPLALVRAAAPLAEAEARAYLHFFLFGGDQAFTPVEQLSYGERARLNLALILLGGANVLLLDEPLNHLDIPARERLEQALLAFPGASVTVAHDRAFISHVATRILVLADGALREYADLESFTAAMRVTT